ncbi:MAG TPA: hypothetical protein VEY09_16415 [Pyrinomonadaceae bacterium]|nr:hypothetical protein [Pyrinomonadaceae bacterium]
MRIVRALCFFVTLLLLLTPLAWAQHSLSVPDRVERAIKEKEPSWNLVSVMVRKTKEENYSYFRLKYEEQEVGIHMNEYEVPTQISPNSLLTAAPRERTLLKDIGDEAYLLSSSPYGRASRFDVVFRKGKVRISIEAGSAEVAKRIATYLADALPPRNNGMHPTPHTKPLMNHE